MIRSDSWGPLSVVTDGTHRAPYWGPSTLDALKWQGWKLVRFVGQIRSTCYGIGDKSKGFQKLVYTRLKLLLLLLRLLQPLPGDARVCILYTYIIPKPNNEEITYSTIGYRRLNTIILWTSSSEWWFEETCRRPSDIVEHKRTRSVNHGHKPDCHTNRRVFYRKHLNIFA